MPRRQTGHFHRLGGAVVFIVLVDHDHAPRVAHAVVQVAAGQHRHWLAIVEQVGQADSRVRRIERYIGGAGLEGGQYGHYHIDAALEEDADPLVRTRAQLA
ncbi:hypothetical protein D3C87_1194220 [compost metagenome]